MTEDLIKSSIEALIESIDCLLKQSWLRSNPSGGRGLPLLRGHVRPQEERNGRGLAGRGGHVQRRLIFER